MPRGSVVKVSGGPVLMFQRLPSNLLEGKGKKGYIFRKHLILKAFE